KPLSTGNVWAEYSALLDQHATAAERATLDSHNRVLSPAETQAQVNTYIALFTRAGFPARVQVFHQDAGGNVTGWPPLGTAAERDNADPLLFVVRLDDGSFAPLLPAPRPQVAPSLPHVQLPLVTLQD